MDATRYAPPGLLVKPLALAAILALTAGVNNVSQLRTASAFYGGPGSPAGILRLPPVR